MLFVLGKCVLINCDVLLIKILVGLLLVFLMILFFVGDGVFLVIFVIFIVLLFI